MLLDLSKEFDVNKSRTRLEHLISKKAKIDMTEKFEKRSVRSNAYFHAILTIFACEMGETIEYVKQRVFKGLVNPEIFVYERVNTITGEIRKALRSSADLDSSEMNDAITRFIKFAADEGIHIMSSEEYIDNQFAIKQMAEINRHFL